MYGAALESVAIDDDGRHTATSVALDSGSPELIAFFSAIEDLSGSPPLASACGNCALFLDQFCRSVSVAFRPHAGCVEHSMLLFFVFFFVCGTLLRFPTCRMLTGASDPLLCPMRVSRPPAGVSVGVVAWAQRHRSHSYRWQGNIEIQLFY